MPHILSRRQTRTRPLQPPPVLTLNRPTILLACICVLRIHTDLPDIVISVILFFSFPDIHIRPNDVRLFFDHTCVNRPGWVREIRAAENGDEIVLGTMELLTTRVLANTDLFSLAAEERERQGGLEYIAALIGCETWRG